MVGTRDVLIAGGGIIGLSLALELATADFSVTVIERDRLMRGASWAAAGMLAAEDPHNPVALAALAKLSRDLYPEYLARIEALSQMRVPLRTRVALQECGEAVDAAAIAKLVPGLRSQKFVVLAEGSIDPHDLCVALPVAAAKAGIEIVENTAVIGRQGGRSVTVETTTGDFNAQFFVDCRGVSSEGEIEPRKGQMLAVAFAAERLRCVVRTEDVYLVPRGDGRVVIGATVERGVRDSVVHLNAIDELVVRAEDLLPGIGQAPRLDSWAGVRPGTPDDLPVIGPTADGNCFVASGHFRNGILLAPGTARVMAQLLRAEKPDLSLDAFSPGRFAAMYSERRG